jgi:hypothetical protein
MKLPCAASEVLTKLATVRLELALGMPAARTKRSPEKGVQ